MPHQIFPESRLAHKWLDPLAENGRGVEIGGSAHNPFSIKNTINVDFTDDMNTSFKILEETHCGRKKPVDVVAFADDLPFKDSEYDFLIACHVFEHCPNSIKTLLEWRRVVRNGGIIYQERHITIMTAWSSRFSLPRSR